MRFRYMQMSDIPEAVKLYQQSLEDKPEEEIAYPAMGERSVEEFTISLASQLISNANWFAICGVVGSTLKEDAQGVKHVVGGKVKAFISVSLSQRTVGSPKNISFTELLVVDRQFRTRDIARKLVQLMAIESAQRGAHVLEAAWTPGSIGSKIWERLGCVPYRVLGAWITLEGEPRQDLPMVKAEPEIAAEPDEPPPVPKRRGRPPKPKPEEV
jgi:hypothetical protein